MNRRIRFGSFVQTTLLTALIGSFSACDGGSSGTGAAGPSQAAVRLTGHVLNDDGPVTSAKIEARDAAGAVAARTEIKGDSVYTLTIPAGTRYPLIVTAYPETEEPLKAAVADASAREQDISAVTTIVVDTAMSLGGINAMNLAKAAGAAISQRRKSGGSGGGGQTTESFKGDPTKQYGGWH